jgi:NAD(P)-dependent dehydrogenase (short-subunit alcohol dehydrogenase family)
VVVNNVRIELIKRIAALTLDDLSPREPVYSSARSTASGRGAEDVARALLCLASDDPSFVAGAELVVDDGLPAHSQHRPIVQQ